MLGSFGVQLLLWFSAAASGAISILVVRRCLEKESRLPEACSLIDVQSQLATKQTELSELKLKVADANELFSKRDQANADVQEARQWIQNSQHQLELLQGERQQQELLRQELAAEKEELDKNRSERQKLVGEVVQLRIHNQNLVQQNADALKEFNDLKSQHKILADDVHSLEIDAQRVRVALASDESRLESLRNQVLELVNQVQMIERDLAEKRSNKIGLEQDLARLDRDCLKRNEELEALNRKIADGADVLVDLERQISEANQESANARARTSAVLRSLNEIEQTIQRLKLECTARESELSNVRKVRMDEEVKVSALKSERDALIKTIETLKALAEGQRGDLNRNEITEDDRYRDLWQPLSFPPLSRSAESVKEQSALERTADYISGQRLNFPLRVLHAYHTALKVNSISPLVVLAGISGTGKSELPRRYAEGMGMHFVMLAVQPRWDSPQDLFGFYNYLEKRYKATELARALVQFERYNRPSWDMPKDWDAGRDDRMLLVLLDEMNLARVEYYFSEFLSKLETRRGINRQNQHERAKAEIALEMGNLSSREIRLFPDQNVLFTGTMNEDESTQALSDKVLDRACVLRFGRPKEMAPSRNANGSKAAVNGLAFDAWKTWIREATPNVSDSEQVNSWISSLNESMEQIHRPFGHRVAQAIHSYVANYPDWVANRVKLAMADQIEQRILPKLRGIDVEESRPTLEKIRSIISQLGDEKLNIAFQEGYRDKMTFIWRGIDRTED